MKEKDGWKSRATYFYFCGLYKQVSARTNEIADDSLCSPLVYNAYLRHCGRASQVHHRLKLVRTVLQASNTGQLGYNMYNRDLRTSTHGRIFLLVLLKSHLIFITFQINSKCFSWALQVSWEDLKYLRP